MSEYIVKIKDGILIHGFTPDEWMINAPMYHYKKCCLNHKNWIVGELRNKASTSKHPIYDVVCTVCGGKLNCAEAVGNVPTDKAHDYIMGHDIDGGPR